MSDNKPIDAKRYLCRLEVLVEVYDFTNKVLPAELLVQVCGSVFARLGESQLGGEYDVLLEPAFVRGESVQILTRTDEETQ